MSGDSALREFLSRYSRILALAWKQRKLLDSPVRLPHEIQFLPASLALQEQPVHPAPRYIMFTLIMFSGIALVWSCLSEIDVVATATGKVVASGKSKIIQSSDVSVIKSIFVYDGQQVKAGDLLIELDSSSTSADVRRLKNDMMAAMVDSVRAGAMLEAIASRKPPEPLKAEVFNANPIQKYTAETWLKGQYLELESALHQADAEIEQRAAEILSANLSVDSLQKAMPITRRLAEDYKLLLAQQYVPRHAYLEKVQTLLDAESTLLLKKSKVAEFRAAKKEAEGRKEGVIAQARRAMLDLQQQSEQKVSSFREEVIKAQQRDNLMRLTSPIDGTVQELAVHTVGGVVTAAQPLLIIAPTEQPVEVEAMLENKDVGFVKAGQAATVKIETFNFTKYGVIGGEVINVSKDAIMDEKRGLLYSVRVKLLNDFLKIKGLDVRLTPGMSVSVEVKTDKRKVIEFMLSPLERHLTEGLRER